MDANTSIDALAVSALLPVAVAAGVMLAASVLAAAVEALTVRLTARAPWSWSPAPPALRRLLFAACGLSLVIAVPSTAAAGPWPRSRPRAAAEGGVRSPLRRSRRAASARPAGRRPTRRCRVVAARPTDDLDRRTTRRLPLEPGSRAGRAGGRSIRRRLRRPRPLSRQPAPGRPRPDLIFPGTQLTLPEVLR